MVENPELIPPPADEVNLTLPVDLNGDGVSLVIGVALDTEQLEEFLGCQFNGHLPHREPERLLNHRFTIEVKHIIVIAHRVVNMIGRDQFANLLLTLDALVDR